MNAVKKYLKKEVQWGMCGLRHVEPADFYLSVWQTNRSVVPLLIFRGLLFIASVGIVIGSKVSYGLNGIYKFWFIYLTHWGLVANIISTGFATLVSARCYIYGPLSNKHHLPWYVKSYWISYNVAIPSALLITLFYWAILFEAGVTEEPNYALDVAVHGVNSIVMLLLLATSAQPVRLLHIGQPSLILGLPYITFNLIYYLAGGVDSEGNPYVYSVIHWQYPGTTIGMCILTVALLVILYMITVGLTLARDAIAVRLVKPSVRVQIKEEVPLRQPTNV